MMNKNKVVRILILWGLLALAAPQMKLTLLTQASAAAALAALM